MTKQRKMFPGQIQQRYGFRLIILTAVSIFCAEALIMLLIESWLGQFSLVIRAFLDATLLMVCVFPTLYFMLFKEMEEQIGLRLQSEQAMADLNYDLERQVEERTVRLQRANDDLLAEVQERARVGMALSKALKEAEAGRRQLATIIDTIEEGLLVVDAEGRLCLANPKAEELFGRPAYELNGKLLAALIDDEATQKDLEGLCDPEGDGLPVVVEWPSDGSSKRVLHIRRAARLDWHDTPAVLLLFQLWDDPAALPADAV